MLDADPDTDWARVDIPALREHLVDMHRITVDARIESRPVEGGIEYRVSGDSDRTVEAIRRMVADHGRALGDADFGYVTSDMPAGVRVTVSSEDPVELARLRALGLHGLLSLGDHHRSHHLAIAWGADPH